jgi:hypothetical protein
MASKKLAASQLGWEKELTAEKAKAGRMVQNLRKQLAAKDEECARALAERDTQHAQALAACQAGQALELEGARARWGEEAREVRGVQVPHVPAGGGGRPC